MVGVRAARRILDQTPTIAVSGISLTSAEQVVTALVAAGANAHLEVQETSSAPDET
jgi:ribosomal protein L7/L12